MLRDNVTNHITQIAAQDLKYSQHLAVGQERVIRTSAGHIDYHIDIDIQITRGGVVHAKFIIWPALDKLANIIREKKSNEGNKEGEETTLS